MKFPRNLTNYIASSALGLSLLFTGCESKSIPSEKMLSEKIYLFDNL